MGKYDFDELLNYAVKGILSEIIDIERRYSELKRMESTKENEESIEHYKELYKELTAKYEEWRKLDDVLNPWEELEEDNS